MEKNITAAALLFVCTASIAADFTLDQVERMAIQTARPVVTRNLKDPQSAQFRTEFAYAHSDVKKLSDFTVCGEINAKNAYGGYVGFRPYVVMLGDAMIRDEDNSANFDIVFRGVCLKLPPKACVPLGNGECPPHPLRATP